MIGLDGNSIAGMLYELYGQEMTTAAEPVHTVTTDRFWPRSGCFEGPERCCAASTVAAD